MSAVNAMDVDTFTYEFLNCIYNKVRILYYESITIRCLAEHRAKTAIKTARRQLSFWHTYVLRLFVSAFESLAFLYRTRRRNLKIKIQTTHAHNARDIRIFILTLSSGKFF